MRRLLPILLLALLWTGAARAVEPNERLADPVLEARARQISQGLRCLVCRNETIDESGADLAHDVRMLLRERLTAGDTDEQAVQAIVRRYGDYVLLNPPLEAATYVLWFAPPTLLVLALGSMALVLRRRRQDAASPSALSEAEQRRIDAMLQEDRG